MISRAPASPPATVWRWTLEAPHIAADLVLRLQKYRDPAAAPRVVRAAAIAAASQARRLTSPSAVVWHGPVALGDDHSVTLGERHTFHTRLLSRMLADSHDAYVVVLTLGEALEQEVDAMFRERFGLEGLLLETAGWAAIELLIRDVRRRLRDDVCAPATTVTHRLAPGYGDWPVDDQAALLAVFGDVPLPVCVSAAACLFPRKSISAVFGVVPRR